MAPWPQRAPLPCPHGGEPTANAVCVTGTPCTALLPWWRSHGNRSLLKCLHGDPPCSLSSFTEVPFAPSPCPEATGAPCPGTPLGPPLAPSARHTEILQGPPQSSGITCTFPRLTPPSPKSLTCHTSLHVHPVPSWPPPKTPWVSLLLWALPASTRLPAWHLLPCHPTVPPWWGGPPYLSLAPGTHCPPCSGTRATAASAPGHPMLPLQHHLSVSPVPGQGAGGLGWVWVTPAGAGGPHRAWR